MKRKELMQWVLAVALVATAVVLLRYGPGVQKANAAEGMQSMSTGGECAH